MVNNSIWTTEIKQSNQDELKKMLAEAEEKQTQTVNAFVEENIDLIKQLINLGFSIKEIAKRLNDNGNAPSSKSAIETAIKKSLPKKKSRQKSVVKTAIESETLVTDIDENKDQKSNSNSLESNTFLAN